MLGLIALLLPLLVPTDRPPALLAALPPAYLGNAADPGACEGPQASDGYGLRDLIKSSPPSVLANITSDEQAGRIGGCNMTDTVVQRRLGFPDLRPVHGPPEAASPPATEVEPLHDLVTRRCVNRKTLRPYTSLALLGDRLAGFALELSPSRNILTLRLIDARKDPAVVEVLGKVGVKTLEWCDRTDVADGHCPNPAQGEIRQAVLVKDQLVLTMALGFADVCGQDDLIMRAFPLPAAARRLLAAP